MASNFAKMKAGSGIRDGSTAKTKFDSSVIKNRVVGSSSNQSIDSKHKLSTTTTITTKIEAKGKSISSSTKTTTVKTREKKVYSLPGQKFDVPEEREPLRIFYESLSKQIPSSEMAEFWMMEHGLLSPERAKKAFDKKKRKQKETRLGTPIKSPPPSRPESSKPQSRGESSRKPQPVPVKNNNGATKSIKHDSDEDDDDFVLSHKRRKGDSGDFSTDKYFDFLLDVIEQAELEDTTRSAEKHVLRDGLKGLEVLMQDYFV